MESAEKKRVLWKKSGENFDVSRRACKDGKFNAAASRFYYGMVFAARALLLERKGIDIGDDILWPGHDRFIRMASERLSNFDEDLRDLLYEAFELRIRGDYEYDSVIREDIDMLEKESADFLAVIQDEIKRNK